MSLTKRALPEDVDVTDPSVVWEYEGGKPVMKNITVPKRFEHELRRDRTPEYNQAVLRDFIKAHPDEVMTGQTFIDALDGLTTAPVIVRKLVERGIVKRSHKHVPGTVGLKYTYEWIGEKKINLSTPVPEIKKPETHLPLEDLAEVPTISEQNADDPNAPVDLDKIDWSDDIDDEIFINQLDDAMLLQKLDQYFIDYSNMSVSPSDLIGANTFRKFIKTQIDIAGLKDAINKEG